MGRLFMFEHSGDRLLQAMKKKNLTYHQVAEWFGVKYQTIQGWVSKGVSHKRSELLAQRFDELAKRLEVDRQWLETGIHSKPVVSEDEMFQRKLIGSRLIEQRVIHGYMNIEKLAKETGLDVREIQSVEFGDIAISLDFIKKLSCLPLNINYILSGTINLEEKKETNFSNNSTVTTINGEGNIVSNNNSYQK